MLFHLLFPAGTPDVKANITKGLCAMLRVNKQRKFHSNHMDYDWHRRSLIVVCWLASYGCLSISNQALHHLNTQFAGKISLDSLWLSSFPVSSVFLWLLSCDMTWSPLLSTNTSNLQVVYGCYPEIPSKPDPANNRWHRLQYTPALHLPRATRVSGWRWACLKEIQTNDQQNQQKDQEMCKKFNKISKLATSRWMIKSFIAGWPGWKIVARDASDAMG